MSNQPAFPLNTPKWHESVSDRGFEDIDFTMGMTLRDYFAAKAMQALIDKEAFFDDVAESAYKVADHMLKARES